MSNGHGCPREFSGLKLLSDVILMFVLLLVAVVFLTGNGFATSAYSADVQTQSKPSGQRHVVHDLNPRSCRLVADRSGRESLILELGWRTPQEFSLGDMRGTLFIDRSDSPVGCVVACRLDTSKLRVSPLLTVRIPLEHGNYGSDFRDASTMVLKARFVERR